MFMHFMHWSIRNFGFGMFFLAIIIVIVNKLVRWRLPLAEVVYRWFSLFPLGLGLLYMAYMHAVYPIYTASTFGWAHSPFQFEVAIADLALGIIAILSFKASYGFRLATIIASTFWLWGNGIGHVVHMFMKHSFSLITIGNWFWLDMFIPLILLLCLASIQKKRAQG